MYCYTYFMKVLLRAKNRAAYSNTYITYVIIEFINGENTNKTLSFLLMKLYRHILSN